MIVHYTKRAARALDSIAKYTLEEWGPEQRDRYMGILEHACEVLVPKRAHAARTSHRKDLRMLRCEHHVIYFRKVAQDIEIVHVLHERQLVQLQGCYPSTSMTDSLMGGTYSLHRGGELGSRISLPLVKHGAFATATSAFSPTADVKASSPDARPLPIDW